MKAIWCDMAHKTIRRFHMRFYTIYGENIYLRLNAMPYRSQILFSFFVICTLFPFHMFSTGLKYKKGFLESFQFTKLLQVSSNFYVTRATLDTWTNFIKYEDDR